MNRWKSIVIPVAVLGIGVLLMFVFLGMRKDPPRRAPQTPVKYVESDVVTLRPIEASVSAYGRTVSVQPVKLYAEVTGTLQRGSVPFRGSQPFRRGDLILKIDDRQTRLSLNTKISQLMTALASVLPEIKFDFPDEFDVWQTYFDALRFDKAIPQMPETDNQRIRLYLARFKVYELYFGVRDLEIVLDKHRFVAPFDGSIASANLRIGSTAHNGSLLGEIIDLEQIEIALQVQMEDLSWINADQPVALTSSEADGQWAATITRVGSDIDDRTQTIPVFAQVDDQLRSRMISGAFLQGRFAGDTIPSAYAIPPKAVYRDRYVYVIVNGELVQRPITIARREIERIIINSGLHTGDTVVTEAMQGVAPGMPAQPKTVLKSGEDV